MKVLVGCEFSQVVTKAFRAKGHEAFSCDLLPCEGGHPEWHLQGDVFDYLNDGWDLMIAHPPCTHLATSGAWAFTHGFKSYDLQDEALLFVWQLMNGPVKRICIENPISVISSKIRKPDQIIQPWYFGDPVPKRTCLWLKNLPRLKYALTDNLFETQTAVEPEYVLYNSKKTASGKSRYSVFGKLGKGHGHEKSVTFNGIAQAMAEQWG